MNLRFHWMFPKGGEVGMKTAQETSRVLTTKSTSPAALPDMEGWTRFARSAEEAGIESVLLSFSRYEPDTILIACAVGQAVKKLKFIVAYRSGLMQPTTFVQQVNTLSALIQGRVALDRSAPEVYVSGHSEQAQQLALTRASCWLRLIDTPEKLQPVISPFREKGIEICLRLCVVCRRTRDEALAAAHALLPDEEIGRQERDILIKGDSQTYK